MNKIVYVYICVYLCVDDWITLWIVNKHMYMCVCVCVCGIRNILEFIDKLIFTLSQT